jgi:DNA-dependent RNA polymerase auxiliary subunit epsilon
MLVLELDPEHGVRQRLDDRTFDLDCISLSHRRPLDPDYVLEWMGPKP